MLEKRSCGKVVAIVKPKQGGVRHSYILTSEVGREHEKSIALTASWAETETFEFGGEVVRCDKK